MQTDKTVHCERKGNETYLEKTRVVTKINGVINLKLFDNPQIDFEEKMIHSSNKPPIKFFSELYIPTDLKHLLGDLFATVVDEDELEQSTHILSDEGRKNLRSKAQRSDATDVVLPACTGSRFAHRQEHLVGCRQCRDLLRGPYPHRVG